MNKPPTFVLDYYDREIISLIIGEYGYAPMEAVELFITSDTHSLLEKRENRLWCYPPHAVFQMWEEARDPSTARYCALDELKQGAIDEETAFFILLLEYYAAAKERPTGAVLREWNEHGITQEIHDYYELYHTERIENAYEDIDSLLATGKHAWW